MSTHASLPDDELVRLAAAGDRAAFAVLFHRHVAAVHRTVGAAATDASSVRDLIVAVFVDAMRNLDELATRSPEDVGATLVAIAQRRTAGRRSAGRLTALTVGAIDAAWRELDRRWPDGELPTPAPTWWPSLAVGATAGVLVLAALFAMTPEPRSETGPGLELAAEPVVEQSETTDDGVILPRPRETVDLSTISPTPRPITPSPSPIAPEPSPEPTGGESPTPSPTPTETPTPTEEPPPDQAPDVTISSPQNGATVVTEGTDDRGAYATVSLAGSATDDRDDAESLAYSWLSDIDGGILQGPAGTARLHVPDGQLTATHTVTLMVTDSAGNVGRATVRVIVTRSTP